MCNTDKNSPAPICEDSHETCPSPYSIIMDNLDFFIHTRNQSISRSNQSIHWINHIAVKDRISTDISNIKPTVNIEQYNLCLSLPSRSTQVFLRRELTVLATRMLAKHMPVFESFQDTVVHHIPHEYSSEMSKRSTDVSFNQGIRKWLWFVCTKVVICIVVICNFLFEVSLRPPIQRREQERWLVGSLKTNTARVSQFIIAATPICHDHFCFLVTFLFAFVYVSVCLPFCLSGICRKILLGHNTCS